MGKLGDDGLTPDQRYRLKDVEAYRERKAAYARTPEQREKRRLAQQRWRERNREKHNADAAARYRANRDDPDFKRRIRGYQIKAVYGLSHEDFDRMLAEQEGGCAICGGAPPEGRNLHIDHNHETGEVRGLLCGPCNTKLGWFELRRTSILEYLKEM